MPIKFYTQSSKLNIFQDMFKFVLITRENEVEGGCWDFQTEIHSAALICRGWRSRAWFGGYLEVGWQMAVGNDGGRWEVQQDIKLEQEEKPAKLGS